MKSPAKTPARKKAAARAPAKAPRAFPTLALETVLIQSCGGPVCGVDEAGRGPWAGPVSAGAVILNPDDLPEGIDDSKVLTVERREALEVEIKARGFKVVGPVIVYAFMQAVGMVNDHVTPCFRHGEVKAMKTHD